jgi:hypothetical protein
MPPGMFIHQDPPLHTAHRVLLSRAWREKNPSHDLITALLNAEFRDVTGEIRRLSREEAVAFLIVIAGPASRSPAGCSAGSATDIWAAVFPVGDDTPSRSASVRQSTSLLRELVLPPSHRNVAARAAAASPVGVRQRQGPAPP